MPPLGDWWLHFVDPWDGRPSDRLSTSHQASCQKRGQGPGLTICQVLPRIRFCYSGSQLLSQDVVGIVSSSMLAFQGAGADVNLSSFNLFRMELESQKVTFLCYTQ
jgi:hypothetical protein